MGMEIREVMGDRATFQIFGGAALVCAALYGGSYAAIVNRLRSTHSSTKGVDHEVTETQKSDTLNNGLEGQRENGVVILERSV